MYFKYLCVSISSCASIVNRSYLFYDGNRVKTVLIYSKQMFIYSKPLLHVVASLSSNLNYFSFNIVFVFDRFPFTIDFLLKQYSFYNRFPFTIVFFLQQFSSYNSFPLKIGFLLQQFSFRNSFSFKIVFLLFKIL